MKPRLPKFPFKKPVEKAPHIKIHCVVCKAGKYLDGAPHLHKSVLEDIEKEYKSWKYYTKKR